MFDRLKIATKLLIGFGSFLLLILVIVGVVIVGNLRVQGVTELSERRTDNEIRIIRAQKDVMEARADVWGSVVLSDKQRWLAAQSVFGRARGDLEELIRTATVAGRREQIAPIIALIDKYTKEMAPLGTLRSVEDLKSSPVAMDALAAINRDGPIIIDMMAKLAASVHDAASKATDESNAILQGMVIIVAVVGLASLLLGVALSILISRSIRNPIVRLTSIMRLLAEGDLAVAICNTEQRNEIGAMARSVAVFKDNAIERQRLEAQAAALAAATEAERERVATERARIAAEQALVVAKLGESLRNLAAGDLTTQLGDDIASSYAQIRSDFNEAVTKLKSAVEAVVLSTDSIQAGTQDISIASEDLSLRTSQQASSLEETASALDQISATVRKSVENTRHASMVAASADEDARRNAVVVANAVKAMDAIAQSGRQIAQIIGVMDEIAFQTNLLALNAGVEAARAGDAGRGFAVVASEVRALAQRSAEASKDIKKLIDVSTNHVETGVTLVGETGKSLERIVARVAEINVIVAEIAGAATEQSLGLEEINKAINQIDDVTQKNAAMVEESTAASHNLSQETLALASLVRQFRLEPHAPDNGRRSRRAVA